MAILDSIKNSVISEFNGKVDITISIYNELLIIVKDKTDITHVCTFLKKGVVGSYSFEQLIDVCGVDYLYYGLDDRQIDDSVYNGVSLPKCRYGNSFETRFAVVYHLSSLSYNCRVRLRVYAGTEHPNVPSIMSIWPVADWYEREVFDLFGIEFIGHVNLCRILTDYGFRDFPLRKDFPLVGESEVFYDVKKAELLYRKTNVGLRRVIPKIIISTKALNNR
jgi:NADH-quinone oxidoreductase subunit C